MPRRILISVCGNDWHPCYQPRQGCPTKDNWQLLEAMLQRLRTSARSRDLSRSGVCGTWSIPALCASESHGHLAVWV